jgi:diguanylate cyclase (GGDEF)-like protein
MGFDSNVRRFPRTALLRLAGDQPDLGEIVIDLSEERSFGKLLQLLLALGIHTPFHDEDSVNAPEPTIPPALVNLDSGEVGVAVLDAEGCVRSLWGFARNVAVLRPDMHISDTELAILMEKGPQTLYHEGARFYSSGSGHGDGVFIVVVNAADEQRSRRQASKGWRVANTLKRLGKALTSHQAMQQLCAAAAHELASICDLAALMLWVIEPGDASLKLEASLGISRIGSVVMSKLSLRGTAGAAAELVAHSRQRFTAPSIARNMLCADLEARYCYLKAGGVAIFPLEIGDRLIGVLELIGKDGDPHFQDSTDLFETVTEHIALAIQSSMLYERAEKGALQDPLTGIANHRAMQEFIHTRLDEAHRLGREIGVIMIDIDHFRSFNEAHGHDAGDAALKMVAETFQTCVRTYDMAARYGGEEFTLVLPGTGAIGTLAMAERVRQAVAKLNYRAPDGTERPLTVSLGCAVFPADAHNATGLLKAADQALYEAKRKGRNRVAMFQVPVEGGAIPISKLLAKLRAEHRRAGLSLVRRAMPNMRRMAEGLLLSDVQRQTLKQLLAAAPAYLTALQNLDLDAMTELEATAEFRGLMPFLQTVYERYDGQGPRQVIGPRIPLLTRVLQVLLAVDEGESPDAIHEPGRFDPEVIAFLPQKYRAA